MSKDDSGPGGDGRRRGRAVWITGGPAPVSSLGTPACGPDVLPVGGAERGRVLERAVKSRQLRNIKSSSHVTSMNLIKCLFWSKCDPPHWVRIAVNKKLQGTRLYSGVIYLNGHHFKYKVISHDWGQGWSDDTYYRKLKWKWLF